MDGPAETSTEKRHNLFALARTARRIPHPLLTLVVFVVLLFFSPLLLFWLTVPFAALNDEGAGTPLGALAFSGELVASFGGMILGVWLWLLLYEKRPFRTLGFQPRGAGFQFLRGLAVGVAMFAAIVGAMALLGYVAPSPERPAMAGLTNPAAILAALLPLLGWTVQGSAEEVLTRGWLMPVLGIRTRPWVGVLVSSSIFGLIHLANPSAGAVSTVNTMLVGLFFAAYALWERSLWGVCGLHAAWNWAQGNVFGLEVSGTLVRGGMLLDLQETGPDLLTGGAYGPEGGLLDAAASLMGIGVLAWLMWRRRGSAEVKVLSAE